MPFDLRRGGAGFPGVVGAAQAKGDLLAHVCSFPPSTQRAAMQRSQQEPLRRLRLAPTEQWLAQHLALAAL